MIRVEELMIGNLLQNIHGALIEVDCIKKVKAKDGNFYLINGLLKEHLSGIPLTEEILLKCGFEIDSKLDKYGLIIECDGAYILLEMVNEHNEEHVLSKENPKYVTWYSLDAYENYVPIAYPQYLNQLQNLYFAFTGKELEVNL